MICNKTHPRLNEYRFDRDGNITGRMEYDELKD